MSAEEARASTARREAFEEFERNLSRDPRSEFLRGWDAHAEHQASREVTEAEILPTAEYTVIRAHVAARFPGWWGPLIRIGGRYQSVEGQPVFEDAEIVEFEVLAAAREVRS
jgi:hypothetical protein